MRNEDERRRKWRLLGVRVKGERKGIRIRIFLCNGDERGSDDWPW